MRHLLFFITICVLLWLGSSSPINAKRRLINRPTDDMIFNEKRAKRLALEYSTKTESVPHGHRRGYSRSQRPLELNLTKGEYVCGNKICKLKPGEIPKGCNGLCQYPIN